MNYYCTGRQTEELQQLGVRPCTYTLSELIKMAPEDFQLQKITNTEYEAWYGKGSIFEVTEKYFNPAEACAELLITLIENKFITVEGINERLKNNI